MNSWNTTSLNFSVMNYVFEIIHECAWYIIVYLLILHYFHYYVEHMLQKWKSIKLYSYLECCQKFDIITFKISIILLILVKELHFVVWVYTIDSINCTLYNLCRFCQNRNSVCLMGFLVHCIMFSIFILFIIFIIEVDWKCNGFTITYFL